MSDHSKIPTPKWLEDLQQKSWEPEILLSGIVLYGMFKVPDLLDDFLMYFKLNIFGNSTDIENLVALFKMGIYWLITGLILHLICRGIWIGMVGLSYTFPKGIQMGKVHYAEPFREKVKSIASYEDIVIRLEKISSTLFSVSFMLFMSLLGGYFFFLVLLIVPFTTTWFLTRFDTDGIIMDIINIWVFIVLTIGILALIDFLSLGYFRRFKIVAKLYWPVHRFVSALTLSRFYRPIYYGMVSNFNKWVFFFLLLTFTAVSLVGAASITDFPNPGDSWSRLTFFGSSPGYTSFAGSYDDQNEENPSFRAHIPSDIINGNVLKLFVVANIRYEDRMEQHTPMDSLKLLHQDTSDLALKMISIGNFYQILIDGQPIEDLSWLFHYKTHVRQRGYLTYIDISHLPEGMHEVVVRGPDEYYSNAFATIPFFRDPSALNVRATVPEKTPEAKSDFQPKPFGIRD